MLISAYLEFHVAWTNSLDGYHIPGKQLNAIFQINIESNNKNTPFHYVHSGLHFSKQLISSLI